MFPGSLGPPEMLVIMLVAVLLFGKRLPEVGRSVGRGIVEFKKGLRGEGDDNNGASASLPAKPTDLSAPADYTVPKFEAPTTPPTIESTPTTPS